MTIEEIIEELGEPEWNTAQFKDAKENSYYLYELYETFNFWESKVWIFNDLQKFYDFAYSHVLFDYINRWEDEAYEDDDSDQSELYDYLLKLKNTIWTVTECENFVKTFDHCTFEMVQFGKVSDLIAISDEDFDKCKDYYSTKEELENINIKEGVYQIISKYITRNYKNPKKPKVSKEAFLAFLSNW
jgi:hypothetical protein